MFSYSEEPNIFINRTTLMATMPISLAVLNPSSSPLPKKPSCLKINIYGSKLFAFTGGPGAGAGKNDSFQCLARILGTSQYNGKDTK
jgi:hypothetical protein